MTGAHDLVCVKPFEKRTTRRHTHVQETLILMLTEAIRSGSIARATWSIIAGQANYFADYYDPKAVNPAGAVVVLDADEDIEILPAGNNGQPGAPRAKSRIPTSPS